MANAIEVRNLGKRYHITQRRGDRYKTLRESLTGWMKRPFTKKSPAEVAAQNLWALRDLTLDIAEGETVGIVGNNGAGKSTLLKLLSRISEPSVGYATIHGRVGSLLEVGTGFHPELSGRENIFLNGAILGMRRAETARALDDIVAFAEVERFLDTAVKHYSSGMYMRLAFAVAAHLKPEIMLVDEVLAVGDVAFQRKCLGKMGTVAREGRTVLFVSHNMQAIRQLCQRAVWMKDGALVMDGRSGEVIDAYLRHAPDSEGIDDIAKRIAELPTDDLLHVRSIAILQDGIVTTDLLSGKPVEVRIEYEVSETTPGLHFTFSVCDNEGSLVFQSLHNGDAEVPTVPKGRHVSRANIPADFLAPTSYEFRFSAGIANVRGIMKDLGVRVNVTASGLVNRAYPGYPTPGKLAPLLHWTTDSQELIA